MPYAVKLLTVTGTPLLVVRRRARLEELSRVVPEACGVVWNFIRRSEPRLQGQRNVAVYLNDRIDLEVGVEVGSNAVGAGDVTLSATPAGLVATTAHVGPYSHLHEAHEAVRRWCKAGHHRLAGPNWEVYGHWNDDPSKLRTDVFYLVAGDSTSGTTER